MKRQRDSYGCGPIAIYNSKVWRKEKLPSLASLYKRCKTTKEMGTVPKNMTQVLEQEYGLLPRRTSDKTRIKRALKAGNGVILLYRQYDEVKKEDYEHYIFIYIPNQKQEKQEKQEKRGIQRDSLSLSLSLVNEFKDALIYNISFNDFDEYVEMRREYCDGESIIYPCAWVIPK